MTSWIVYNTTDDEFLAKTADDDGSWTSTDRLDRARIFDDAERAAWAKPDDDDETTWEVRPLDLTIRLAPYVRRYEDQIDDGSVPDLLALTHEEIEQGPFLRIQQNTRDRGRYWLSMHADPESAAEEAAAEEYAEDWWTEHIYDVRDGSDWDTVATYKAVPRR